MQDYSHIKCMKRVMVEKQPHTKKPLEPAAILTPHLVGSRRKEKPKKKEKELS